MIDGIGPGQLLAVLVIVLLLFGNRIPEVMRNLGGGIREFKRGFVDQPEPETVEAATASEAGGAREASRARDDESAR
jgi:sec-independent protein translocase protein TatA